LLAGNNFWTDGYFVGDMPLRSQVGAILAAEFGSRVQVETCLDDNGILVTGGILAAATGCAASSQLLVIATCRCHH